MSELLPLLSATDDGPQARADRLRRTEAIATVPRGEDEGVGRLRGTSRHAQEIAGYIVARRCDLIPTQTKRRLEWATNRRRQ